MNTLQTTIPANTTGENSAAHDSMETYDNLYSKSDYGTLDYPVNARCLDLHKSYMNWIRWHWHEEMEILIVDQGIAEVSTDDTTYLIKPGQGLIINQNVMHCIHAQNQKSCTFHSLIFHPDFIFGHRNSYLQTEYLLPMQNYHLFKAFFLDESAPWHERMLKSIKEVIDLNLAGNFGYEIATKGYLCHFWVELLRQLPQTEAPTVSHVSQDEQRVKEAMLFIRTHYAEPLTLLEIADSIHVSKSECCRCFARTLQMSPFEYLMKYRIYESTKKLMDSEQNFGSIADLAGSVGFNNTSYFNKLFKKFLGCTPTHYKTHKVLHPESERGTFSYFL
ncbi:MAG: AraC family transcriptional regulator [Lachnospiraceae bacterium]|nr:AraC family transcriptional regulator [Lachnospiraceae bacterium]